MIWTESSVASALGANSDVSNPHSCLSIQTNGLLQLISSLRQEFYVHKKDVMDQDPKLLIHWLSSHWFISVTAKRKCYTEDSYLLVLYWYYCLLWL